MNILTSSSLGAFRKCPQLYFNMFELRRVPVKEAAPLAFGKLWHKAMEAYWLKGKDAAIQAMKDVADRIEPEDCARICALLNFYDPPIDKYEVISVEEPFEMPIPNPNGGRNFYKYRLAGKVDVEVTDKETGEKWIIDHKTTTKEIIGFGTYWQALQIDGQMRAYCMAFDARGFIYDAVRKPQLKMREAVTETDEDGSPIYLREDGSRALKKDGTPYTGSSTPKGCTRKTRPETLEEYQSRCEAQIQEDPALFYQWREHTKTDDDMNEARLDLWQQVEMFRSCDKAARWPRFSESCVTFYGTCPYLDVCTGRALIDDDAFFRTKSEEHEELSEENAS